MIIPLVAILVALAIISAIISASEISLISLNKIRIKHRALQGDRRAAVVQDLLTQMDRFIAIILISNNLVNTAISAIITVLCISAVGQQWGLVLATFVGTAFLLVFCEVTPKLFGADHAEAVALWVGPVFRRVVRALNPLIQMMTAVSRRLISLFGGTVRHRSPLITEEEIRLMFEVGKAEGVLAEEERRMLHRIVEFGDTLVKDVMVPRAQMVTVNNQATSDELLDLLVEEGYSRLPVYERDPDQIIGVIYARDLLHIWRNRALIRTPDLIRQAHYVRPDQRVSELLRDFQRLKLHMAIVVDDAKKAVGLVTLEDLIEEIVGEISDEYD